MLITPPPKADYGFYNNYVSLAPEKDLITALQENLVAINTFAEGLTNEQLLFRYDTGKWNIKEVLVHLVDAERNFCYRAMRISRGDETPIPALSVYEFVLNSFATERELKDIIEELTIFRKGTIAMYGGMHPSMLDKTGPARDVIISVRALGYAIVGHAIHHMNIVRERYLKDA